jgi:hypothetical protein
VCKVGSSLERIGCVRMQMCKGVCVKWGAAVEQTQVSSNAAPCLHSNVNGAFERRVQSKFFFLQRYLQTENIYNQHIN